MHIKTDMLKKAFITASVFMMTLFSYQAAWAGACYTMREAEAEQGIRIHSELMVIGLNCQHIYESRGKNLYRAYREFTSEHADLFARYENILMDHYSSAGYTKPEKKLDRLRTDYANDIADNVARMQTKRFCAKYAPRIPRAVNYSRRDIRQWASTFYSDDPVSKPICSNRDSQTARNLSRR